jgi:hypothetical protein
LDFLKETRQLAHFNVEIHRRDFRVVAGFLASWRAERMATAQEERCGHERQNANGHAAFPAGEALVSNGGQMLL